MRCNSRKPVRHMYGPCRECPDNIPGYGVCKRGFDNYYERRTKKNACPKLNTPAPGNVSQNVIRTLRDARSANESDGSDVKENVLCDSCSNR